MHSLVQVALEKTMGYRGAKTALAVCVSFIIMIDTGQAQETTTPTAPDGASTLDVIIVTARRREETAQKIPVSVTALDGDALTTGRTNTLEDLAELTPNVVFNPQSGPITIRGVGSLGIDGGLDRQLGVGLFIDEVYIRRPQGFPVFLDDLERAEIVRGSQSTLYGENTIGGAINLISRRPKDSLGGDFEVSTGSLDYFRFRGGVDLPISKEYLRTRSFITYTRRDGYIDNDVTGNDEADVESLGGRFVAEGDLGPNTDYLFTADFERGDDDGGIPFVPVAIALDRRSVLDFPPDNSLKRGGASLRINHSFGQVDVTSITAYRGYDYEQILDGDFSSMSFLAQAQEERQRQITQEIRFSGTATDWLSWRAGGFFLNEDFDGSQFFDFAIFSLDQLSRNRLDQTSRTLAAYGEIALTPIEKFEFTAGLRYTREKRDGVATVSSPSGNFFFGPAASVQADVTFDEFLPEFSLSYEVLDTTIAYARIARGFKAGGISQFIDIGDTANVYEPETSWSYEVGTKTSALDGKINLNLAAFAIDWQNQQARISVGPVIRVIRNAAKSSSYGFEAELAAKATDALLLNLSYGFVDASYDDFVVDFLSLDFSDADQPYAPNHSVGAGFVWQRSLVNDLDGFASGSYSYRSSYTFDPEGAFEQPQTHIVDAELGIGMAHWSLSVWGKNLADEAFLKGYFRSSGVDFGAAAEGRTWGISLKVRS